MSGATRFDAKKFAKFEEDICSTDFKPVRKIYIDLVCMKDLRMGLLLSLAKTKEDFEFIKSRLEKWNSRVQRGYKLVYPDWKYSEEELQKMYLDPERANLIFNSAPDTYFSLALFEMLHGAELQNSRADYKEVPSIVFNLYPQPLDGLAFYYIDLLRSAIPPSRFELIPISCQPDKVPASTLQQTDIFVCDDFASMVAEGGTMFPGLFESRIFTNSTVYSSYQVADDILKLWMDEGTDIWNQDHIDTRFDPTAMILEAFCYFSYCHYQIPITT